MKTLPFVTAILFLCASLSLKASDTETGKVSGKILDQTTNQPISYATIALIKVADTSIVAGVISDESGTYSIGDLPNGEYQLKVSYIGYESLEKKITIDRKQKKVELGELYLRQETTHIDEVVVQTERLKGETKVDRTVYNLNDDIRNAAADGIDVLKHIPAVQVDFQDNVSFEGQSNIQFYVDGVLRNQDYVSQLDPSSIDKIEVISNPGVKYDADISAVINVVLTKEKRTGISGSVRMEIPHPDKVLFNPSARLEYGNQKFRVYASNRTHFEKFNGLEHMVSTTQLTNGDVQKFIRNGVGENRWVNNYTNYGIDIFLSEKTSLNFFGESSRSWNVSNGFKNQYQTFSNNQLVDAYSSESDVNEQGISNYYSVYLKQKLANEGDEFTAEISFYDYTGENKANYLDSYETGDVLRKELVENRKSNASLKLDYTRQFDNVKHEMGIRSLVEWINNDFNSQALENTENFKYQEIREAAYYNLTGSVNKVSWQTGIRAEYSKIGAGNNLSSEFVKLLPQANVQYSMEKGQNIKLSFRRKINRPGIDDLNPFEKWTDSLHVWYGNPELDPSLHNKFELSYGINFGSNYISPKLFYDYSQNEIQQLSFMNASDIMEFRKDNVGKSFKYGMGLTVSQQITKWWRINAELAAFNQVINSDHDFNTGARQEKVSYRANGMNMFSLPKEFTLMGVVQFNSPTISYQRTQERDVLAIIGMSKNIGKSWQIEGFYVPFIDKFTYQKVTTEAENLNEVWYGQVQVKNIFSIGITYKFNRGKQVNKIARSTDYENDVQSGGF